MTLNQLEYLMNDIVFNDVIIHNKTDIDYKINNGKIVVLNKNEIVYTEPLFDFSFFELNNFELQLLTKQILNLEKSNFNIDCDFPFLKVVFFLINEMYLDLGIKDIHSRVCINSVKKKYRKLLEVPITDVLIKKFFIKIKAIQSEQFLFNLTCDYDIINFWGGVGFNGIIKFFLNLLFRLRFLNFFFCFLSLIFSRSLIFLNFYLNDKMFFLNQNFLNQNVKINNFAFILLNNSNAKYDFRNKFSKSIVNYFLNLKNKGVVLSLHPSYDSSSNTKLINSQLNSFFNLFNFEPKNVRYHYLRIDYDTDLQILEDNQFSRDFTFGFADSLLFRGGITKQFKKWNFNKNKKFNVDIIPIIIMDSTLFDYLKFSEEISLELAQKKLEISLLYGFQVTTLIHNNNLSRFTVKGDISKKMNKMIFDFVTNKLLEKNDVLKV